MPRAVAAAAAAAQPGWLPRRLVLLLLVLSPPVSSAQPAQPATPAASADPAAAAAPPLGPPEPHGCDSAAVGRQFGWQSKAFDRLRHLHHPAYAFRPLSRTPEGWGPAAASIHAAGHNFCTLARDNWSCAGRRYTQVLKATAPFNDSLSLLHLAPGTVLYGEGNSFFMEMMFSWVCETSAANPARVWVWKLGGNVSSDLFVCVDTKPEVSKLLLLVPPGDGPSRASLPSRLRGGGVLPTVVAVGGPGPEGPGSGERLASLGAAFPGAGLVSAQPGPASNGLGCECGADFMNCEKRLPDGGRWGCRHQCFPGPWLRHTETFAAWVTAVAAEHARPTNRPWPGAPVT